MTNSNENSSNFLTTLVSSDEALKRFFLLALISAIVAAGTSWFILKILDKENTDLQVAFSENGATTIKINKSESKALFLLPASSTWVNTGISLTEKSIVTFNTSGKINLGVNNLVKAADKNIMPKSVWTGPNGYSVKLEAKDAGRTKLLVNPDGELGTIIGYIEKQGDTKPGVSNPRPTNIFEIHSGSQISKKEKGTLWLCINDFLMSSKELSLSYSGYVGDTKGEERKKRETEFLNISQNGYWHLWFDDNIGEYLIQMEIKETPQ